MKKDGENLQMQIKQIDKIIKTVQVTTTVNILLILFNILITVIMLMQFSH